MANTLKYVAVNEIDNAAVETIYTVPASTTFTVTMCHIANTTNAAKTIQLHLVPPAGAAAQANALLYDFSVPANDYVELLKGDIWATGVSLQAKASAANCLNIKLAGIETA